MRTLNELQKTIKNTQPVNKIGYVPCSESHKSESLKTVDEMMRFIGDRVIPSNENDFADLFDSVLGDNPTNREAYQQMHLAKNIIEINNIFN